VQEEFLKMSEYKINMGGEMVPLWVADIAGRAEPESTFVGYLDFGASVGYVFWCPKPREGFSNQYFGISTRSGKAMIYNADKVAEGIWEGLLHVPSGEVIFSRYRHDFREFSFGGPAVDGGRDYMRIIGNLTSDYKQVQLRCVDGKFQVVD
jgi:hypothetical protein